MKVYENLIQKLAQAKIPSPRLEARLLLLYVLKENKTFFDIKLSPEQEKTLNDLFLRRTLNHEPLDKILGHKEFYKYDFIVNKDVLSPRPDTEILLEEALKISQKKTKRILDLGTGSGCLLLSFLKDNPQSEGIGVDISSKALHIAQQNAEILGVTGQVSWLNKSWQEKDFCKNFDTPFDMIISNPPYISEDDIAKLDSEVKDYDPLMALCGGKDGYNAYREIAKITPTILAQGGYILLECGYGQAETVADIFMKQNLFFYKSVKDLQGIERCVILKK